MLDEHLSYVHAIHHGVREHEIVEIVRLDEGKLLRQAREVSARSDESLFVHLVESARSARVLLEDLLEPLLEVDRTQLGEVIRAVIEPHGVQPDS